MFKPIKLAKYPSTPYLPWTAQADENDTILDATTHFEGKTVVVTEKMDGENTSLYHNHIHARSLDSRHHPSRDWVKGFWGGIRFSIPENVRICGENVYAEHSIRYDNLPSYFLGFSVWDENEVCWDWQDTLYLFEQLGIQQVPHIYIGEFNQDLIHQAWLDKTGGPERSEGYVIRVVTEFHRDDFTKSLAKYVRENHVQTDQHWMDKPVVPNGLA
jgi:hypothetical protein